MKARKQNRRVICQKGKKIIRQKRFMAWKGKERGESMQKQSCIEVKKIKDRKVAIGNTDIKNWD